MSYLKSITKSDRVTFEGCEVVKILPDVDPKTKEVTHFTFTVIDAESIPNLRYFRATEITTLIEREKIVIDRGYYSAGRQIDRDRNGETELISAKPAQRDRAHRYAFLARTIDKLHSQGMPLTRDGVDAHFKKIHADYKRFQARVKYGTLESNSNQTLLATPSSATLLEISRKLRNSGGNPACFVTRRLNSVVFSDQHADDYATVMSILNGYAHESCPSKGEIAQLALETVKEINVTRRQDGFPKPMREYKSVRTYERWIDKFLDPFTVEMTRNGAEKARKKFGSRESGNPVTFPGERVEFDAWQFHIVTLDVTRKRWLAMTVEERKAVKRVRRWVVVAIDVATRCILGFSICSAPSEQAALEAFRTCYLDKTFLLQSIGNVESHWNFQTRIRLVATDSGSEFGKQPFGGSGFSVACRAMTSTLMNPTTGVPNMRGHIERFFRTLEYMWARKVGGWTTSNILKLGDRQPKRDACLTDDDLQESFIGFIDEYHNKGHRGLGLRPPMAVWEELTKQPTYDPTLPGPRALRKAFGTHITVKLDVDGVRYAENAYTNDFVQKQPLVAKADRLLDRGNPIEAIVDPFDLGSISIVLPNGKLLTLECQNKQMMGKSLRQWTNERNVKKQIAAGEREAHASGKDEARKTWLAIADRARSTAEIGIHGYSKAEIDRAKLELSFGKGSRERPYVGIDEQKDLASVSGLDPRANFENEVNETGYPSEDELLSAHIPGGLDRFRTMKPNQDSTDGKASRPARRKAAKGDGSQQ